MYGRYRQNLDDGLMGQYWNEPSAGATNQFEGTDDWNLISFASAYPRMLLCDVLSKYGVCSDPEPRYLASCRTDADSNRLCLNASIHPPPSVVISQYAGNETPSIGSVSV